jgi:hypothetical protein
MRNDFVVNQFVEPLLMLAGDVIQIEEALLVIRRLIEQKDIRNRRLRGLHIGGMNHNGSLSTILGLVNSSRIRVKLRYEGRLMVNPAETMPIKDICDHLETLIEHVIIKPDEVRIDVNPIFECFSGIAERQHELLKKRMLMAAIWRIGEKSANIKPTRNKVLTADVLRPAIARSYRDYYICSKLTIEQLEKLLCHLLRMGYPGVKTAILWEIERLLAQVDVFYDAEAFDKMARAYEVLLENDSYLKAHSYRIAELDEDSNLSYWIEP